ncbi:MAG: hypothetical protein ACRD2X_07780 [Vicinamibacteraceae bacterium]
MPKLIPRSHEVTRLARQHLLDADSTVEAAEHALREALKPANATRLASPSLSWAHLEYERAFLEAERARREYIAGAQLYHSGQPVRPNESLDSLTSRLPEPLRTEVSYALEELATGPDDIIRQSGAIRHRIQVHSPELFPDREHRVTSAPDLERPDFTRDR